MPGKRGRLIEDSVVHAQAFGRSRLAEAWQRVWRNEGTTAELAYDQASAEAWQRVWRNEGAAGGDGIGVDVFAGGVVQRLALLAADMAQGTYGPGPLRRVLVPKKNGGQRPLDIPCVRDRVAQTALAMTLGPLLDEEFEEASFAYRPGRSVAQAVRRVSFLRGTGLTHVVDADISRFFERVPHDLLMDRLAESMTDGPCTALVALWLEHWGRDGRGLAQGSPLSPLLANLYLDRLDETFAREDARIIRFADDFVVLCRSERGAEEAVAKVERLLARQGLELNRDKTRVGNFDEGFRFLGHAFVRSFVLQDPDNAFDEGFGDLKLVARQDALAAEEERRDQATAAARRSAGLDAGQKVLYLMEAGRRLSVRGAAFVVEDSLLGEDAAGGAARGDLWRDLLTIHPIDLDRIEIGPRAEVTREALHHALGASTEVAFVDGAGQTLGWTTRGTDGRAARQLAQAAVALDPRRKLEFAKQFVDGRVRNQRALLRRLNRDRADERVLRTLALLNHLIRRLPKCPDAPSLLGLEGRAASLYWPAFGHLLNSDFSFRHRIRDEAEDGVNIMLNLTASLLARDIAVAVRRAGLHAGFGLLHESGDHREALVYDLMEEFRAPLAEASVSSAINQRVVGPSMLTPKPGGGGSRLLGPARTGIIRTYQRFVERDIRDPVSGRRRTWRALMSDQALRLAQAIETGAAYRPIVMDY